MIGDEVSEHNRILGGMQDNMDKTDSLLGKTLRKLTEEESTAEAKTCVIWFYFLSS